MICSIHIGRNIISIQTIRIMHITTDLRLIKFEISFVGRCFPRPVADYICTMGWLLRHLNTHLHRTRIT
jgi:hypothetical protein